MMHKTNSKYKILLIGWYGNNAIGDDIMAEVTKRLFFEEAEKRDIKLQFVPLSIVKNLPLRLIYQYLFKNDLIIIGGGSILGFDSMHLYMTIFGFDRFNLHKISRNRKTPLVIFGGGFRREKEKLPEKDRIHMKKLFDNAILKGVRGPISRQLFISNRIVNEVEVIGDPALSFYPTSVNNNLNSDFNVAMNVRFMKTGEPQYLKNEEIYTIFAKLADYFIEEGAQIYFFSFTENKADSDTKAAKRVIELMKHKNNPKLVPFSNDTLKMCSLIAKFDYLISQRLHPCILGWVQKVPNIGFEYQFLKTTDFMKSIGMDEFIIRTDEFSFDAYLEKYERMKQNRQLIIERSQESISYWRKKQREFINICLDIMVDNKRGRVIANEKCKDY
jgi:polysaccharide pyruvyl transferase WcaK-like protein